MNQYLIAHINNPSAIWQMQKIIGHMKISRYPQTIFMSHITWMRTEIDDMWRVKTEGNIKWVSNAALRWVISTSIPKSYTQSKNLTCTSEHWCLGRYVPQSNSSVTRSTGQLSTIRTKWDWKHGLCMTCRNQQQPVRWSAVII